MGDRSIKGKIKKKYCHYFDYYSFSLFFLLIKLLQCMSSIVFFSAPQILHELNRAFFNIWLELLYFFSLFFSSPFFFYVGYTAYGAAKEIISMCWAEADARLRDEFFVQICKQTTSNTQLLVICLTFFFFF